MSTLWLNLCVWLRAWASAKTRVAVIHLRFRIREWFVAPWRALKSGAEKGPYRNSYSTDKFPLLKGLVWWSASTLGLILFLSTLAFTVGAQEGRAKRVLIISTGSRFAPGFILVDQQSLQALAKIPSARIETYAENLDLVRFPSEPFQQILNDY